MSLCLISFCVGFFNVHSQYSRGIGNNSVTHQFSSSVFQNPIEASYRQQQPPLDYYLSAFSQSLFGESKFSIRSHAMWFYLLLSFILPLGLYFFCASFWMTFIGSGLFLANHVIRLHSIEGRPLMLALLTGFLFLFFYLSYCQDKQSDKKQAIPVLASQYLFAMSIGLQPVVFIISLFLSSFWLLFDNKKDIFKSLFITNAVTAILTLPFYLKMFFFGRSAYKFKEVSLSSVSSYFTNIDIVYFLDKYFFTFYKEMSLFYVVVILGFISLVFLKKLNPKRLNTSLLMIMTSTLLFPILFDSIFNIGVIWNGLHNWYIIVFSLFLILFTVLCLKEIHSLTSNRFNNIVKLLYPVFFTLGMFLQIQSIKSKTQFNYPYQDNSIEKIYNYLQKEGNQKDVFVDFSLRPVLVYRQQDVSFQEPLLWKKGMPSVVSFSLYYHKEPPYFFENPGDQLFYIKYWPDQLQPETKNVKVFFIAKCDYEDDVSCEVLPKLLKGHKINDYMIFQLTVSDQNKEQEYIKFLNKINKHTPKKYKGAILETLIYYAYRNNDKIKFNRLLQDYRDIESALDEFTPDMKYPSRFELKRRVRYFENLKWD